ncbi:MAG: histidine--tRNA ligase [Aerococcus sp.]|nr:histidine--tRNA ligase [Aerococcus sp.]
MIQRPKGTSDILPETVANWHFVEDTAREILDRYRFFEMRTPIFESYDLFSRGVGETTDVVTKEMYVFEDKGGRRIALRPEGTAPIVRAYIENKLYGPEFVKPYKVYYMGPMFRYERPQGGRQRQFHQLGVEVFGGSDAWIDVETIAMAHDIFKAVGITDLKLVINSLGDTDCRLRYRKALIDYLTPYEEELSEDSRRRLHENPLRVLDSKEEADKRIVVDAPSILDYLSDESKARFEKVKKYLEALNIEYVIDPNMVRGLDYYQETIFEMMTEDPVFGAKTTVCGGGNYTGLVQELSDGKVDVSGFGFAVGMERLLLLMEAKNIQAPQTNPLNAFMVTIGEEAEEVAMPLMQQLRQQGFSVDQDVFGRKPKKQYKEADKREAELAITIGEEELKNKVATVKNLKTAHQETFPLNELRDNFAEIYRTMLVEGE